VQTLLDRGCSRSATALDELVLHFLRARDLGLRVLGTVGVLVCFLDFLLGLNRAVSFIHAAAGLQASSADCLAALGLVCVSVLLLLISALTRVTGRGRHRGLEHRLRLKNAILARLDGAGGCGGGIGGWRGGCGRARAWAPARLAGGGRPRRRRASPAQRSARKVQATDAAIAKPLITLDPFKFGSC